MAHAQVRLLCFVSFLLVAQGLFPTAAEAQTGSITGTVTHAVTGDPLADITVRAYSGPGVSAGVVVTGPDGRYTFSNLPSRFYYLSAGKSLLEFIPEGYGCAYSCAVMESVPVAVSPGAVTSGIDFSLSPPATITGTVTSASTGQPIAFAPVRLTPTTGPHFSISRSTDISGVYQANTVPPGSYYVTTASVAGHVDERYNNVPCDPTCDAGVGTPVILTAGATTSSIDFVLDGDPPPGVISGTVRNAITGAPVGVANVTVRNALNQGAGSGITNSAGQYSIAVAPGVYTVRTSVSPAFVNFQNELFSEIPCEPTCPTSGGTPVVVTSGATTGGIDFTLAPGSVITGTITGGTPAVPLGSVPLTVYDFSGTPVATGATTGSGAYSIGLLPGTYLVQTTIGPNGAYADERYGDVACLPTCAPGTGTAVVVAPGVATTGIDFFLDATSQLSGAVTDAATGAGIQYAHVEAYSSTGTHVQTVFTNAGGTYSMRLPGGTYFVQTNLSEQYTYQNEVYNNQSCTPSCNTTSGTPVVVSTGAETFANFALNPGGTITGTITNGVTGTPLVGPGVRVEALAPGGTVVAYTNTVDAGRYTLSVPTGTYKVRVPAPLVIGTNLAGELYNDIPCPFDCPLDPAANIAVASGATVAGIDFVLGASSQITGRVADTNGLAQAGVTIIATALDGSGTVTGGTSSWGYYALNAPPGSYSVRTRAPATLNLIDELHNDHPCVPGCDGAAGTPVHAVAGTPGDYVDFILSPGGMVTGTTTSAATGQPVWPITVEISTASGEPVATALTEPTSGRYTFGGLPTGSYRVRTLDAATKGYVDTVHSGISCNECSPTMGTPVQVTAGSAAYDVDLVLEAGGALSGVARNPTGVPLSGVEIRVYNQAGALITTTYPIGSGVFTASGLAAGTYFARTNSPTFVNEWYGGVPCVDACETPAGSPIVVAVGVTTDGVDFELEPGGSLTGTVTDSATGQAIAGDATSVSVDVFSAQGVLKATTAAGPDGRYRFDGLAAGSYFVRTVTTGGYIDEQFNDVICLKSCTPAAGTPIAVVAGAVTPAIDFALSHGGQIAGVVTDESSGAPLAGVTVRVYAADGTWVAGGITGPGGAYVTAEGLPPGSYHARTFAPAGYLNEIFSGLGACLPNCMPTAGAAIPVGAGVTTTGIDFALDAATEFILNGGFTYGIANWSTYATPAMAYMDWRVSSGAFEFSRLAPPAGTTNQAVLFQNTGVPLAAGAPLVAQFDLANTSSVRKRLSVLMHDADFSDLSVCTFWLPPNMPSTTFAMRTRTTRAWSNATVSFYGASTNVPAGYYRIDNVSLQSPSFATVERTDCVEPGPPAGTGVPPGAELLVNGDFASGAVAPGWAAFGQLQAQVADGVFEFTRMPGLPTGVLLQRTGRSLPSRTPLTATFELGNSSAVRKRVTVILHDNDFSDLSACTFWLEPGQPLLAYSYRAFTTKAWGNATLSVYPSTIGPEEWIRFDNASLRVTAGSPTTGVECIEPGGTPDVRLDAAVSAPLATPPQFDASTAAATTHGDVQNTESPASPLFIVLDSSPWVADGFDDTGNGWAAVASPAQPRMLQSEVPLDLTAAVGARLSFESWLTHPDARASVEVSEDGLHWETVWLADPSDTWMPVEIDLAEYLGSLVHVRFVLDEAASAGAGEPPLWRLRAATTNSSP